VKAYQIFEKPDTWTRGAPARNRLGGQVHVDDPAACMFCVQGAIQRTYPTNQDQTDAFTKIRDLIAVRYPDIPSRGSYVSIVDFNDVFAQDQNEVLSLLRDADV